MFENNAIFWVEVDKIRPNPYQPRREFDDARLRDLADSIRQYGVLQPIVVSRIEVPKEDGGLAVEYELIAGERRVRASKLAGIAQIPVIIRGGPENDRTKLELAIIENLQREDLSPIDRARAFARLAGEFGFSHSEIGRRIGKSRVSVTNTIRILGLPEEILAALAEKKITEGHTRPLLMLTTRAEEQLTLFREIVLRQMPVREAEGIARRIAVERARKRINDDPDILALERSLSERFGTRVQIERRGDVGGKVVIDYFSPDDLNNIVALLQARQSAAAALEALERPVASAEDMGLEATGDAETLVVPEIPRGEDVPTPAPQPLEEQDDADLYTVKNFTI
ncbi:MAG: ParB/RepB/Spo0J family partition protein [bacterium]|nr:ParB/RepB/Spo0J family partition protein [bacterium]MDZ4285187.1 ParB/RepB/Spo0J family partition protein [Patescibacteria group bacterium]